MDNIQNKIKDLEFLLKRSKVENKKKIKDILYQILEIYNNLAILINISEKEDLDEKSKNFIKDRFSLIGKNLIQILYRNGVSEIESLGQHFNYEYHEIIEEVPKIGIEDGEIIEVIQSGYMYEGDVLQMAKVKIASNKNVI